MDKTSHDIIVVGPNWVESTKGVKLVLDPVGLRNPAQAISNQILQGLTVISPTLRVRVPKFGGNCAPPFGLLKVRPVPRQNVIRTQI